jgi:hypothetical protein
MFYEGLYLVQKTGVNTARTLYVHESYVRKILTATMKAKTVQSFLLEKQTQETKKIISTADPGYLSRIRIFSHPRSGSRGKKSTRSWILNIEIKNSVTF